MQLGKENRSQPNMHAAPLEIRMARLAGLCWRECTASGLSAKLAFAHMLIFEAETLHSLQNRFGSVGTASTHHPINACKLHVFVSDLQ